MEIPEAIVSPTLIDNSNVTTEVQQNILLNNDIIIPHSLDVNDKES